MWLFACATVRETHFSHKQENVLFSSTLKDYQNAYEGKVWYLNTVTFWVKFDFCNSSQLYGSHSRAELVDKRKIQKGLDETHPYHNIHRCNQPAKAWGSVQFFFECHLNVHDILTLTIRYISGSHSVYILRQ